MKKLLVVFSMSLLIMGGPLLSLAAPPGGASRQGLVQDREVVAQAQRRLKALGYDPGPADGAYGPQTEAALREYQRAFRLPITGRLDEATARSLLAEDGRELATLPDLTDRRVVEQAQRRLKALGYDPGPTDGNFGAQTEAALREYQLAFRLPQTGELDEATARSLMPEQFEGSPALTGRSQREVVEQAQRRLKALGYDPGPTDGNVGPQTEAAVREYQRAFRLPVTGKLDEATVRSLLPEKRESQTR